MKAPGTAIKIVETPSTPDWRTYLLTHGILKADTLKCDEIKL